MSANSPPVNQSVKQAVVVVVVVVVVVAQRDTIGQERGYFKLVELLNWPRPGGGTHCGTLLLCFGLG